MPLMCGQGPLHALAMAVAGYPTAAPNGAASSVGDQSSPRTPNVYRGVRQPLLKELRSVMKLASGAESRGRDEVAATTSAAREAGIPPQASARTVRNV